MEKTVKQRLIYYIESKGLSKTEFGRRIGVSSAFVTSMRKSIQPDKIKSIALNFPDLNTEWLLTGEGEMLKNELADIKSSNGIPYYDIDFTASFDLIINSQTVSPAGFIDISLYRRACCWCNVTGHSMSPTVQSGDIMALEKVSIKDVLYGEVYAIVTDGFRTVKRIRKAVDSRKFLLVPDNNDYDPQEIEVTSIINLYRVLGTLRMSL